MATASDDTEKPSHGQSETLPVVTKDPPPAGYGSLKPRKPEDGMDLESGSYHEDDEEDLLLDINNPKSKFDFSKAARDALDYCIDNHEGLDCYQMCAFYAVWGNRQTYVGFIFKCIFTAIAQIFALVLFAFAEVTDQQPVQPFCRYAFGGTGEMHSELRLKVLTALFAFVIAYSVGGWLQRIDHQGLYSLDFNNPRQTLGTNVTWLRIGESINYWVLLLAVWGSFVVIKYSDNAEDIVLNSVALFFMIEMDDLMIGLKDYHFAKEKLEEGENGKLKMEDVIKYRHTTSKSGRSINMPNSKAQDVYVGDYSTTAKCNYFCNEIYGKFLRFFMAFTLWVSAVVPFLMFVCY